MKGDLQKALDEAIGELPHVFLRKLIGRKLAEAGIKASDDTVQSLAEQLLASDQDEVVLTGEEGSRDIMLTLTNKDRRDWNEKADKFLEDIPAIIKDLIESLPRGIGTTLRRTWPEQKAWQEQTQHGFEERLADRWGDAFDLLGMLLTVSREVGEETHRKPLRSRAKKNRHRNDVLIRLHARACQVAAEVIVLMKSGYADGAMARWRTLHEIGVVATLIAEHGDDLAERYLLHDAVESKKVLDTYRETYEDLGYKPPPKREAKRTERLYEHVLQKYGREFRGDYGWAANQLSNQRPTFSDLEKAAQRSQMHSHYKMACQNVHAGIKGITQQLGVLPGSQAILAGASNAGLEEPGQNTAITLTLVTFTLFGPRWQLDDVVMLKVLADLQNKAVKAFVRAGRRLERDEAARQIAE